MEEVSTDYKSPGEWHFKTLVEAKEHGEEEKRRRKKSRKLWMRNKNSFILG